LIIYHDEIGNEPLRITVYLSLFLYHPFAATCLCSRAAMKRGSRTMKARKIIQELLFFFVVLAVSFAQIAPAQAATRQQTPADSPAPQLDLSKYMLPIRDFTLSNGLRVILAQDSSAPVTLVNVTYHVGGANDPEGRTGFAHLFEHLMFRGSENVKTGDYLKLLSDIGTGSGKTNAYTNFDRTVYYAAVASHQLPLLLWLESDRMGSLVVDQEGFETEREVVIEELYQRYHNTAYAFGWNRTYTLPFLGYAPYSRRVIGSEEDLNEATLEEVIAFHEQYYVPNNATITIVGDIDFAVTKALVEAYFGDIPAGEAVQPVLERYPMPEEFPATDFYSETGCAIGYAETLIDPLADQPGVFGITVGPALADPDFPAASLLAAILGTGQSSRFERNLVQTGLVPFAYAFLDDATMGAYTFQFEAYVDAPEDVENAQALVRTELDKIIQDGVSEEELARAKNQLEVEALTLYYATPLDTSEALQTYARAFDDPDYLQKDLERYRAVTVEDVQAAAQKYLCERPLTSVVVLPEGEAIATTEEGVVVEPVEASGPLDHLPEGVVSRAEPPVTLPAADAQLPPFVTFVLDNGLTVVLVEQNKAPVVSASLYVGGGTASVPLEEQGVADLLAATITKGTTSRSAEGIAATIESIGGAIAATTAPEHLILTASGPSLQHETLLDVMADVALHPTFPQEEFTVRQDQLISDMTFDDSDPTILATRQFQRIAFGGHPYSYYSTPERMGALTPEDVAAFHESYFKPNNALLVITGDLSEEAARTQAEELFGTWEAAEVPDYLDYPEVADESNQGDSMVIYLVDQPDAEQATVRVGNRAIRGAAEDRYPLIVANHVLGGRSLNSRLNLNLRVEKGYTYGVRSNVDTLQDVGAFIVAGSFGEDVAGAAVQEILLEIERLGSEPLTAEELRSAKSFLSGYYLLDTAVPETFANLLATTYLLGLPWETVNAYVASIEALTAEDIQQAAQQYMEAQQPVIVVVGNAEVIQPQLEELGEVVVVDVHGELIAEE
jgi:zinc protease